MFTGIIEAIGVVAAIQSAGIDSRLYVKTEKLSLDNVQLGDSIAVNGICLTVIELPGDGFWADVSGETLSKTAFNYLKVGSRVNLEKAVQATTHLGGHLVSGHVDGIGKIIQRSDAGRSVFFKIKAPDEIAKYIAAKGSITINGISLTVNAVNGSLFELNIVPHTLTQTTLNECYAGNFVNLEVDIIARYLERLLLGDKASQEQASQEQKQQGLTLEKLADFGFIKN
ncbi:MAG: riboflavin synthase [Gammaproteobacteria bacterium]|nr:riboflavin synthase [Gammaproteobacteria bacterium]